MTLDNKFQILLINIMKAKLAVVSAVIGLALLASPVLAQKPSPFPTPRGTGLTNGALRACEARQDAVKNRMMSLTNLATNIEKVFDSIATRVETFYTDKVLPSGKTVSNYDALVAAIAAKKTVVDTDLASAQTMVNEFSCTTGSPRTLLTQFRVDMQKVKSDLKDYRTSIKNLIVAVRPLAPEASPEASESPKASETPEPSATPEASP